MNYGKAIKIVRTAHGLTQSELAERLSIGPSHLSLIESGKRQASLQVLDEIATALDVPSHLLTLLASDPAEIRKRADPREVAELAHSLLNLLGSVGEQRTLPMRTKPKRKLKRVS